jgi:hypothetical protein
MKGSVPKVVEKRKGISYPIADESKTGASGGPRKGGYADERRISHWARADLGLSLVELAGQPLEGGTIKRCGNS